MQLTQISIHIFLHNFLRILGKEKKRKLEAPVNSPVRKLVILYCKVRDLYDRHFTVKKMIKVRKL